MSQIAHFVGTTPEVDMFVRWKRRELKRRPGPTYRNLETGEEVPWDPRDRLGRKRETTGREFVISTRNINWQHRARKLGILPEDVILTPPPREYALDAVLVESVRIDGKPRQRYIAYLATIREDDLTPDAEPRWRVQFWRTVDKRLAELDLGDGDRARITDTLEDRVPRLTAEQNEAELDRIAREARMMRTIMGGV